MNDLRTSPRKRSRQGKERLCGEREGTLLKDTITGTDISFFKIAVRRREIGLFSGRSKEKGKSVVPSLRSKKSITKGGFIWE